MITSRGLVERDPKTLSMLQFDPGETVRSVQLYGVDPMIMARGDRDLVRRVRRWPRRPELRLPGAEGDPQGRGAALPYKRDRLRTILEATVRAAQPYGVPVTIKTRIGIDDDHQTFLDAGRIAEQAGCAAIALHGRTAQQAYSGHADWSAIAALKAHVSIPVLGNGDIWEAVGRAADGRPRPAPTAWSSAAAVSAGPGCFAILPTRSPGGRTRTLPVLGEVTIMLRRHAELLVGLMGEPRGCADLRKHMAWYFKGFPVGGDLRSRLAMVGLARRA